MTEFTGTESGASLEESFVLLREYQEAADLLEDKIANLRHVIAEELITRNTRRYNTVHEGREYKATLVTTTPVEVDFDQMVADKVLTDKEVELVTERKFSKKRLLDAINDGEIPQESVVSYLRPGKEKISVRFVNSEVQSDGEGDDPTAGEEE